MARDAELDRLKAAQDLAFQRKQDAYQRQQSAWTERVRTRDVMNRAHEAKQTAYQLQDSSWQDYQRVLQGNKGRIDQLFALQETAYQNMVRAYENSRAAYDRRDGAGASSYAEEGRRYKAESQGYVSERRGLVEAQRSARARHDESKPAFVRAKERFAEAKREFDRAKKTHEEAQAAFQRAKTDFDSAKDAFQKRLEVVRGQTKKRRDDNKVLAERAGVPLHYRDNVWVSTKPDGSVNLYFGGFDKPNGPGHGHYAMDRNGNVTYRRDPYDAHGAQNFTDAQQDYTDVIGQTLLSGGEFGFHCRFRGFGAFVESGYDKQGRPKINIYYGPNGPFGSGHHHAVALRGAPYEFVYDGLRFED